MKNADRAGCQQNRRARSKPAGSGIRAVALSMVVALACARPQSVSAADLDLSKLRLVFSDEFRTLSVSAHGPATTWTAHTPWAGDFGDAKFVDPRPDFPFHLSNDGVRIEMRRDPAGQWQSGLLSSTAPNGAGFSLQYGYFELCARLPTGGGVWPAFWLDSRPPAGSPDPSIEIDVLEHYGKFPAAYNSTVTVWPQEGRDKAKSQMTINHVASGTLSAAFHRYGVKVDPAWITFYRDGVNVWRVPTPPEHKHPLGILIDLGLGGGWPTEGTPNPSFMDLRYVRAYALD